VSKQIMETFSVPSPPTKFNNFQITAVRLIVANGVLWGVLPLAITNIQVSQTGYGAVFALCENGSSRSRGNIANRTALQTPFAAALVSIFEKYLLNNPLVAPTDKLALGIHSPSTSRSVVAAPTTAPLVVIHNGESLQVIVVMHDAATGKVAKPKGVGFMEVWYKIGSPEPVAISECINKVNIHKSGSAILFDLADKANRIYLFCRWINTKGSAGPWTNLITGVVS